MSEWSIYDWLWRPTAPLWSGRPRIFLVEAFWLCWAMLLMSLVGLEAGEASGGYSIQGWFAEHGLPSCKIRAITETRDGYLWLATAQGIARFDGNRFTVFTGETHPALRGGGFFAAIEAPDGTLWFGGDHGVFRWHDGRFDKVTTREGLPDNYVRSLKLTRDGTLVACTRRGFSFLRQGRFSTPEGVWRQVTGVARCYLERANGTIVLATSDGLWQISGDRLEEIPDPLPRRRDDFAALLETPDGSLWIGHSGGVRRIGPDGKREDYGPNQGLADPHVSELKTDREGNIWIGTVSGGLFRLDHGRIKTITRGQEFGVTPIAKAASGWPPPQGSIGLRIPSASRSAPSKDWPRPPSIQSSKPTMEPGGSVSGAAALTAMSMAEPLPWP
ncbi:MAG: hypothetical protein NT031_04945 [Planctomycetota bacterium]|nr:hypothetical protein [Planctomycetota bacterium]